MKKVIILTLLCTLLMSCGTTSSPNGGFIPDSYFNTKFTMLPGTGNNRLVQDCLVETFIYPFVDVMNFATFRFIWDHSDFPCSGFVHTMLDVLATIPGYSHTDIRFKKVFGFGDTGTTIEETVEEYPMFPSQKK
ncbi:MAG: hypothetical protein KBC30_00025 [Planctomycetes bacterium]|jgi:hypothetical protein|nr:hypothetical protein [Planctomycetota bacterium]HNZ65817.1 hypothetical protein [Planctomycetota bacterium]HPY73888.1 hypothetical protein [Planctomycetota bacterium]HQA99410.1 hypothetical protein [Planctomycetota bacterium]